MPNIKRLVRFGYFGVVSSGILLGTAWLLHDVLGLHEYAAAAVAYIVAVVFNFATSARLVYGAKGTRKQFARFVAANVSFRAGEYVLSLGLMALGGHYLAVMFGVAILSTFVKFFAYGRLVFRP